MGKELEVYEALLGKLRRFLEEVWEERPFSAALKEIKPGFCQQQ